MVANNVVVVGGGIVGCMTAMALKKRGCHVTIVERNTIASQTSGESSWAGTGIVFPLLPWDYSAAVNDLTSYGIQVWPSIIKSLEATTGLSADFHQSGFLVLPPFDMQAASDWCAARNVPMQQVKASQFGVRLVNGEEALWLPTVYQVRPPYLMKALRAWLEQHEVRLIEQTQLMPLQNLAAINAWQTTDGRTIEADQFVVTSGAWSYELLKETTQQLHIKPMRGQILMYQPQENLKQMVYREGFYLVPRLDGYLLAGSTLEDVGFNPATTEEVKFEIAAKAEAIMPSLKTAPIVKHWAGLRPGTPQNLPVISAHPTIAHLYLNTGHFRYGLTMSPASAELVADIMCGTSARLNPAPFSLTL